MQQTTVEELISDYKEMMQQKKQIKESLKSCIDDDDLWNAEHMLKSLSDLNLNIGRYKLMKVQIVDKQSV